MIFAIEPLENCWHEIYDQPDGLAFLHWNETQAYRHSQPYAPDFNRYNSYAKAGWFLQATVRDEGRIVGYSGFYIVPSMHTQVCIATEDTWYLRPEYRKGWNAIKFYKYIESICAQRGVVEINLTIPNTKERGLGLLLERLDYSPVSVQYSKHLVRADSAIHPPEFVGASNVFTESTAKP